MPIEQALSLPAGTPEGDLFALLEPYLWVDEVTPVRWWPGFSSPYYYEVGGIVKPQGEQPLEPPVPENQEHALMMANAMRQHLFGASQTAICAAEDAGYLHERHPEIKVGGDIRHDRDRIMDLLVAQVTLRMWLRPARG